MDAGVTGHRFQVFATRCIFAPMIEPNMLCGPIRSINVMPECINIAICSSPHPMHLRVVAGHRHVIPILVMARTGALIGADGLAITKVYG